MAEDPDILVPLTTARTEFEGQTIAAALGASGIQAQVFMPGGNAIQAGVLPINVMVRRRDLERAAASLKQTRQDSVDIDWSEVDVGQSPEAQEGYPLCPSCGYDRQGMKPLDACPECGFVGVPQPPRYKRTTWRRFVRRAGLILLGAAFITGMFTSQSMIAVPALIVAVMMIFWEVGDASQVRARSGSYSQK